MSIDTDLQKKVLDALDEALVEGIKARFGGTLGDGTENIADQQKRFEDSLQDLLRAYSTAVDVVKHITTIT